MQDDRLVVVWDLPLGLGVDTDHVAVVPDLLQQLLARGRRDTHKRDGNIW